MKVILLPENITNFLPLINKVLPAHSPIPVLSNILLEATEEGFTVRVTDLEMGTQIKIPAKVVRVGAVTVPGKEFLETINSLPKEKLVIEQDKDNLTLTCRDNRITLNTIPKEEFPQLYKTLGEEIAVFEREEFVDIFSYLAFSVSLEESRPQLTGVFIDFKEGGVNFASTDGYRMSLKRKKGIKIKGTAGLIISVKLINEIIALRGEDKIVLYVNKKESQVIFKVGEVLIVGRMIDGKFPDYEKVIPEKSVTVVRFEREELLQATRLVSIFAKSNSNIASLTIQDGVIKVETKTQGVGEGEARVECQKEGEDNKISFNIKYLMDLLRTVADKTIELGINSATDPATFEVKEKNFTHIIMPIQVDG